MKLLTFSTYPHQLTVITYCTLCFGRTLCSMYLLHPVPLSGGLTFSQSETALSQPPSLLYKNPDVRRKTDMADAEIPSN